MNIIEKIKLAGLQNELTFNISGDKYTRVFFNEVYNKPYKILSLATGSKEKFNSLCLYLIQNKKDCQLNQSGSDYVARFIEGNFEVLIKKRINGHHFISFYKR